MIALRTSSSEKGSPPLNTRHPIRVAAFATSLLASSLAMALDLIIPWPEGGETDALMRPIVPYLSRHLGEPVVAVNLPGNFGTTGVLEAAKRPADGNHAVSVHEYVFSVLRSGKIAADPLAEMTPVCGIVYVPSILGMHGPAAGVDTLKTLLASKRQLRASWTIGPTSTNFMALALLERATGTKIEFKQYSSKAAAISALNDGEVDIAEINPEILLDPANSRIAPLALSSRDRDRRLPTLPTLREQGIDVDYSVHRGLAVPAKTPPAARARLEKACEQAAAEPELDTELARLGARALFLSTDRYDAYLTRNRALYASGIGPRN